MKKQFGLRIKELREEKNLSQDALAKILGKSGKQVIGNWEGGRAMPSLTDLPALADALGTTSDYLLRGTVSEAMIAEPPAGYVMMKATTVIDLQQKAIQNQAEQIARLKNADAVSNEK